MGFFYFFYGFLLYNRIELVDWNWIKGFKDFFSVFSEFVVWLLLFNKMKNNDKIVIVINWIK